MGWIGFSHNKPPTAMRGPRQRSGAVVDSRRQATNVECMHEQMIVDAIVGGRWPHACDAALVKHAATCDICCDVVTVAVALHEDEAAARHDPHAARLPSVGLVWWRATIRARAEATRVAERPLTVAQGVAGACAVGLACGLAGVAWQSVQRFQRVGELIASLDASSLQLEASAVMLQRALPIVLGLGACLLIAPLAIYFVLSDD
jgi:hypothetical protein